MLTDCREKHVVQKQRDEDDEEDEFPRLTPSGQMFHQFRWQPGWVVCYHRVLEVAASARQKDN